VPQFLGVNLGGAQTAAKVRPCGWRQILVAVRTCWRRRMRTPLRFLALTLAALCASAAASVNWLPAGLLALGHGAAAAVVSAMDREFADDLTRPPDVPGAGAQVLLPFARAGSQACSDSGSSTSFVPTTTNTTARDRWRDAFVCTAGCSEREPELEHSLAPWADWDRNSSGIDMLDLLLGFCQAERSCKDPFIIAAMWRGDVYLKTCRAGGFDAPQLYLIGPEDLSLVITQLLAAQRLATMPSGPTVFGIYLSDYTCLMDRHLIGPGIPMFAYLKRETSWVIPWPSSFTLYSTYQIEQWQKKLRQKQPLLQSASGRLPAASPQWSRRTSKAFWIGTITGPWDLVPDAGLAAVPRLKLLRLTKEHPLQLQAEWSSIATYGISWAYGEKSVRGFLGNESRTVENLTGIAQSGFRPLEDWANFKYYMNLDGVVMGGRTNKLMALGGVVLQHQAGYREHIDALAEPYVHYLPVEYDLSDLVAKVQWLQSHDAEAQRMANRARELAWRRMRLEDHLCYVWRALEAIGARTAAGEVGASAVERRFREAGFTRVSVKDESMRATLESFWGTKLEKVATGDRVMSTKGIELIQWMWDRFGELWSRAHPTA